MSPSPKKPVTTTKNDKMSDSELENHRLLVPTLVFSEPVAALARLTKIPPPVPKPKPTQPQPSKPFSFD